MADRGAEGALLYLDRDGSSFRLIDLQTLEVETLFGARDPTGHRDGPAAQAMFNGADAIACREDGELCYLSDTCNHVIRTLNRASGTVGTLAGAPGEPGDANGSFAEARFAWPAGLALDEQGQQALRERQLQPHRPCRADRDR